MGLLAAIQRVQTLVGAISGIKQAPDYPSNKIEQFPMIIAYPGPGTWDVPFNGLARNLGQIIIDLHAGPQDKGIREAVQTMLDYFEEVPKAILDDWNLGGNVETLVTGEESALSYDGLMTMKYGSIPTYGLRWRLRYKREESL